MYILSSSILFILFLHLYITAIGKPPAPHLQPIQMSKRQGKNIVTISWECDSTTKDITDRYLVQVLHILLLYLIDTKIKRSNNRNTTRMYFISFININIITWMCLFCFYQITFNWWLEWFFKRIIICYSKYNSLFINSTNDWINCLNKRWELFN